ncbi:helix-turn-helix transcriptional regulator [Nonomuraea sp. K274]|uniref:Helix-turn-helix transcriptional regulator n=1 Tax=Nonomuraea cypriaca TaxID=1187855 RepID=A0A931AKN6_9ACTN|nr:helix-turn-helix transcriptional regulator [Nonomuraea cypriaca]MBF8193693.1 helix-turn-helix transcriptional regulator [Nonomuraea cypriaca]
MVTHQPEQRNKAHEAGPVKPSRPGLVRARLQRGLTQEQAADEIGVSLSTWARWERGTQTVRPFYRKLLVDRWGAEPAEVEMWLQVTACSAPAPCADTTVVEAGLAEPIPHISSVETARQLWRLEMDTSRRHLLVALPVVPAALGEWLLAWRFDEAPAAAPHTTGKGVAVGMADVQRVREAHHAFALMDHQFGAGLVRPAVTDFMNTTLVPLLQGSATEQVRAQLLSAAAGMTRMAGWMAFDLGHQGQAQAHFGQALSLAKEAGDDLTAAWVLATMAQQACDLGHGRWAVRLASAAADAGARADAPAKARALLSLRQARAHSIHPADGIPGSAHTKRLVTEYLSQADKHFSTGTSDRDPVWVAHFGEAELAGEGGLCWRGAGEFQRGVTRQQEAIAAFGTRYPRSIQLTQTSVAEGYLGMREIEAAVHHARAAVGSAKDLTSARAAAHLHAFAAHLQPYRDNPHARDFTDYLRGELAS